MDLVTVSACPLCEGSEIQPFDRRVFRSYPVQNVVCLSCGFVYQSPRMDEDDLAAFYEAEYRRTYQGREEPTHKDLFVQEKRAASLVSFLKEYLPTSFVPKSFMDIGCSSGQLLEKANSAFGLQGVGIEPGEAYRSYAQRRGLNVVARLEDLAWTGDSTFSLVSMIHVLEHLPDPASYLQRLRQDYLSNDSLLLVEVPNLYAHDSFEVAHLSAFSSHTLKEMLKKAGYDVLSVQAHGNPRSKVLPLYLTAIAQPARNPIEPYLVQPEESAAFKRQLGMLRRRIYERLLPGKAWLPIPQN
jgi:2-polyprenyl-3-methyl-5-hydroxy-6-metoxy-1,4-benzoquinol methylase